MYVGKKASTTRTICYKSTDSMVFRVIIVGVRLVRGMPSSVVRLQQEATLLVEQRYPALERILKAPAARAEPDSRAANPRATEKGVLPTECHHERGLLPVCIKFGKRCYPI
jgi:hypothetical protein